MRGAPLESSGSVLPQRPCASIRVKGHPSCGNRRNFSLHQLPQVSDMFYALPHLTSGFCRRTEASWQLCVAAGFLCAAQAGGEFLLKSKLPHTSVYGTKGLRVLQMLPCELRSTMVFAEKFPFTSSDDELRVSGSALGCRSAPPFVHCSCGLRRLICFESSCS